MYVYVLIRLSLRSNVAQDAPRGEHLATGRPVGLNHGQEEQCRRLAGQCQDEEQCLSAARPSSRDTNEMVQRTIDEQFKDYTAMDIDGRKGTDGFSLRERLLKDTTMVILFLRQVLGYH